MPLLEKLQREDASYCGYSHASKISLEITLGKYQLIAKIFSKDISYIYRMGLHPLIREELLRDIRTIKSILEKSEKGVKK